MIREILKYGYRLGMGEHINYNFLQYAWMRNFTAIAFYLYLFQFEYYWANVKE